METQRLLFLAVLLLSSSQTEAEVVQSVSDCAQFFLNGTPPEIPGVLEGGRILNQNRYKSICQTYENNQTFFTLYDATNKIPVFSAYKYTGEEPGTRRPNISWMIEPQLENSKNMVTSGVYENQASDDDYRNNGRYDRGHLFPSSYGFTQRDKNSTFTLTNAVPQAPTFNNGSWNKMENCIKCVMSKYCINRNNRTDGSLVTGAEPGTQLMNNKINIPSVMWSAFCCYSSSENKWLASAHWGDNVPDTPVGKYMETKTLYELQLRFSRKNTTFQVFPQSQCPLNTTVTEFYPGVNAKRNNCNCFFASTTTAPPTAPVTSTASDSTHESASINQAVRAVYQKYQKLIGYYKRLSQYLNKYRSR